MKLEGCTLNVVPVFLFGSRPTLRSRDDAGLDEETEEMLVKYGLRPGRKHLVRKDEDLLGVGIKGVDCFVLLPCCAERFSPLIYMAESGLPVIIAGDDEAFCNALETYESLADHVNVEVAFSTGDVKRKIRARLGLEVL